MAALRRVLSSRLARAVAFAAAARAALAAPAGLAAEPPASGKGQRVVCVSKQITEMLYAIGAEASLVGVDLSSAFPEAAKKLPNVGYHRMLSVEGIMTLRPTLFVHNGGVGPDNVLPQLAAIGIPVKEFRATASLDEARQLLLDLGSYFGVAAKAKQVVADLDRDMEEVATKAKADVSRPRVMILHYGRANNVYLAVGKKSNATTLIEWAGGVNAVDSPLSMRPLSPEVLATAAPDVLFVTDFGFDQLGGVDKVLELPGVSLTPAGRSRRIYRIDECEVIYFGPRTGRTALKLRDMIHR